MTQPALRLRLLIGSTLSILVALLTAGFALAALFSNHIETSLVDDLHAQLKRFVALIDAGGQVPRLTQSMPDPRFEQPQSGLYWQIRDLSSNTTVTSRSLGDAVIGTSLALPVNGMPETTTIANLDGGPAIAVARRLLFDNTDGQSRALEVVVAETTCTLDGANLAFRGDLIRDLTLLAAALALAAWLQVTLGLAPLATIRRGVAAVRNGENPRLEGRFPLEVMPLVNEVNALLEIQETSIAFARARAADLAHGLKTDLTVLNVEAQALRDGGNEKSALAIEGLTQNLSRTIDHQLALSRLRHRAAGTAYRTVLRPQIMRIVEALRRTPRGTTLEWTVDVPEDVVISIDQADLIELLGVLLENATNWAMNHVSVKILTTDGVSFAINDDGPGLTPEQIQRLDSRGKRLDEQKSGTGIGISIARQIVALNGGTLTFERSGLGGLSVHVSFPAVTKTPEHET